VRDHVMDIQFTTNVDSAMIAGIYIRPKVTLVPAPTPVVAPIAAPVGAPGPVFALNSGEDGLFLSSDGVQYTLDQYFTKSYTDTVGSSVEIANTVDDQIYRSYRWGWGFTYAVPVANLEYLVTFKFAEVYHNAAGLRRFSVFLEGKAKITNLDVFAKAGGKNIAYDETHSVIVRDGVLNIRFTTSVDNAMIAGIYIRPNPAPSPVMAPTPAQSKAQALNSGEDGLFVSSDGVQYTYDQYFTSSSTDTVDVSVEIANTVDDDLYRSYRWGWDFTYSVPVDNNVEYLVTLKFAEVYFSAAGLRKFSVLMEGEAKITDLDVFAKAGGKNTAYDETHSILVQDGVLSIRFTTSINNAMIAAIYIRPKSTSRLSGRVNAPAPAPTGALPTVPPIPVATPVAAPTIPTAPTPKEPTIPPRVPKEPTIPPRVTKRPTTPPTAARRQSLPRVRKFLSWARGGK
jgi:ribosome-associated toxin RatA of RatAB toxin-antitoxin module